MFLEENNRCEIELYYKGKILEIICGIKQAILLREIIQCDGEMNLNLLEFKY